jgi:hypothetical protein
MEQQVLWKRGTRGTVPSRTDGATGAQDTERMPPSRRGDRGSCPYLSTGYKIIQGLPVPPLGCRRHQLLQEEGDLSAQP